MPETTTKAAPKTTTQAPVQPTAGQKLAEEVKTAPAAAAEPKKPRSQKQIVGSADEAVKIASERTKGARRSWHGQFGGKDIFLVAFNEDQAGSLLFQHCGGVLNEIGKTAKARAPKATKPEDVLSILAALPMTEAQKRELLEKIAAMKTA